VQLNTQNTHSAVISSISSFGFPVRPGPELSTGQEGCLTVESTKHFKAAEDWLAKTAR